MTYKPSATMVEAAARAIYGCEYDIERYPFEKEDDLMQHMLRSQARAALRAAFAAAIESGEAREAHYYTYGGGREWIADTVKQGLTALPALILRAQDGEK
jgi:hypothetical protein